MTAGTLLPNDVGTALSLQEQIYSWQYDGLTPEKRQALELLVYRAVQLAADLEGLWTVCTREGSIWEQGFYFSRMRALDLLAFVVTDILTRTQKIVERTQADNPDWLGPPTAEKIGLSLEAACQVFSETQKLLQRLSRPWPSVDTDLVRRSREALRRGDGEALDELIARAEKGEPLVKE